KARLQRLWQLRRRGIEIGHGWWKLEGGHVDSVAERVLAQPLWTMSHAATVVAARIDDLAGLSTVVLSGYLHHDFLEPSKPLGKRLDDLDSRREADARAAHDLQIEVGTFRPSLWRHRTIVGIQRVTVSHEPVVLRDERRPSHESSMRHTAPINPTPKRNMATPPNT